MQKKFTLTELLIVIAIIAILTSMLLPVLNKARERAKSSNCTNNMKQVALALALYLDDFSNVMIEQAGGDYTWASVILNSKKQTNYLDRKSVRCPAAPPVIPDEDSWKYSNWFGINGIASYSSGVDGWSSGNHVILEGVGDIGFEKWNGATVKGHYLNKLKNPSRSVSFGDTYSITNANNQAVCFFGLNKTPFNGDKRSGFAHIRRHGNYGSVLFFDGHSSMLSKEELKETASQIDRSYNNAGIMEIH